MWPTLVLFGVEHVEIDPGNTLVTPLNFVSYPYSHSLVMLLVAGRRFSRSRTSRHSRLAAVTAAAIVAALVFSHYVLDVITHRPDMPITIGGSTKIGFGLWNHPVPTLAVESAMFLICAAIYTGVTRARDRIGRAGLWALIVVLVAIYFAALYGPPPPSPHAVAAGRSLDVAVRDLGLLG